MKIKFHFLRLLTLSVFSVISLISTAAEFTYEGMSSNFNYTGTMVGEYAYTGYATNAESGADFAASNETFYFLGQNSTASKTITVRYLKLDGTTGSFNITTKDNVCTDYGICNDEKGNIIILATNTLGNGPRFVYVLPAGATSGGTYKAFKIENADVIKNQNRPWGIRAYNNCYSSKGYESLNDRSPNPSHNYRIEIDGSSNTNTTGTVYGTACPVQPYAMSISGINGNMINSSYLGYGKLMLQANTKGLYWVTQASGAWTLNLIPGTDEYNIRVRSGAAAFQLQGDLLAVFAGPSNFDKRSMQVYSKDKGELLTDLNFQLLPNASGTMANQSSAENSVPGVWVQPLRKNARVVDLYLWSRGVGAGIYRITATPKPLASIVATSVTSSGKTIQWTPASGASPDKYKLEVSTDGGSTWTTINAEYTSTTYNDTDASRAGGACTYRVAPIYRGQSNITNTIGGVTETTYTASATTITVKLQVVTPTFTPDPSVTYTVEQAVAIACATYGATIYYTTDGTDPKTSSTRKVYTGAIRVEKNTTIKAYAVKEGIDDSDVATANYTVNIPVVKERHEPLGIEGEDYTGRATVQLSWTKPGDAYATPTGYNVYRDGELILSNILTTGYIDTNVPSGDHVYTVYSVYNGEEYTGGNATTDIDVSTFNTGNNVYKIEEVYNYVIGKDMPATDGSTYQDLDNRDYSRQGAVFAADRKWYIAMGAHQNSTTSGIFTCDIDDPRNTGAMLNLTSYSGYALPSCNHTHGIGKGQNPGIAFDSAGNMFVRGYYNRYSGSNRGAEPYYADPATSASAYDAGVGLTHALVYKRNANGTYTTAPILVDMKGLKFDEQDTSDGRAQFIRAEGVGRSDFYTIEGNIFSAEGAKLYLSIDQRSKIQEKDYGGGVTNVNKPKSLRTFAVVNLVGSGSTVTASMSNSLTTSHSIVESEGYVLPIDSQPGKYIFERRGNKANIINSISGNTADEGVTLQTGDPTNSSGGFTHKWDNDIIIGLPYSTAPANIGDFRLYLAHNGDLTDIRPLMDVQQSVRFNSPGTNSNSVWFYSEESTYDDESCIYIYMYAPGSRFAKYRLTYSGVYPMPEPTIKLVPKFGTSDNNGTSDLACYDAELSFERPIGTSATGHYENGDTRLTSYTVSVVDKNGNIVTDFNNVSYDDTSLAALEGAYSADNMSLPDMVNFDDASTYTFKILANYTASSGKVKQSFERKATSDYTYSPNAPALTVVHNVARNVDFNQAWNASGENILVQEKFDIYRINIQLHNPEPVTSGDYTIPVSYYSLEVNKGDGNGWQPVQDYPQYVATDGYSVGPDGKTEVSTYGDHIAGNADLDDVSYEFYYFISHGRTYGPLRAVGDASDEDPSQWQYRLTANYGSSESVSYDGETYNPLSKGLAKSAYGEAVPSEEITSVEFIQDCGFLRAYPIPTEGVLNIKSPIEITSVEFYSVSGALVKRVKGNGSNDATVDVSDLAAGTYIVSINGSMSLTIVKK